VEDIEDNDDIPVNIPPKNPKALLKAADGSDDDEVEVDDDPAPALEDVEPDEDDEDKEDKPVETAEGQHGESNDML